MNSYGLGWFITLRLMGTFLESSFIISLSCCSKKQNNRMLASFARATKSSSRSFRVSESSSSSFTNPEFVPRPTVWAISASREALCWDFVPRNGVPRKTQPTTDIKMFGYSLWRSLAVRSALSLVLTTPSARRALSTNLFHNDTS